MGQTAAKLSRSSSDAPPTGIEAELEAIGLLKDFRDLRARFPGTPEGEALALFTALDRQGHSIQGAPGRSLLNRSKMHIEKHQEGAFDAISRSLPNLGDEYADSRRQLFQMSAALGDIPPEKRTDLLVREAKRAPAGQGLLDLSIVAECLVELTEGDPSRLEPIYREIMSSHAGDQGVLKTLVMAYSRSSEERAKLFESSWERAQ